MAGRFLNCGDRTRGVARERLVETDLRFCTVWVFLEGASAGFHVLWTYAKIGKQFQHIDKRGIPFAIIVGEEEMKTERFAIKNLETGIQEIVDFNNLIQKLQ